MTCWLRGDAFLRTSILFIFQSCLISAFDSSDGLLLGEQQTQRHPLLSNYFNEHFLQKGDSMKRSPYATSPIIRFGKRSLNSEILERQLRTHQHMMDPLIRFGKRAFQGVDRPLIRFGKRETGPLATFSSTPHIRFGKRALEFSNTPHIRFGKRSLQFSNTPHIRFGKRSNVFNDLANSDEANAANYYASGELDNMGFSRFRRPNPVEEEDTMLRFG